MPEAAVVVRKARAAQQAVQVVAARAVVAMEAGLQELQILAVAVAALLNLEEALLVAQAAPAS
jgi:hypothetical protein